MKQWMAIEELLEMAQESSSLAEFRKTAGLPEVSTEAALLIIFIKLSEFCGSRFVYNCYAIFNPIAKGCMAHLITNPFCEC